MDYFFCKAFSSKRTFIQVMLQPGFSMLVFLRVYIFKAMDWVQESLNWVDTILVISKSSNTKKSYLEDFTTVNKSDKKRAPTNIKYLAGNIILAFYKYILICILNLRNYWDAQMLEEGLNMIFYGWVYTITR